jgi:hypothetical protein
LSVTRDKIWIRVWTWVRNRNIVTVTRNWHARVYRLWLGIVIRVDRFALLFFLIARIGWIKVGHESPPVCKLNAPK